MESALQARDESISDDEAALALSKVVKDPRFSAKLYQILDKDIENRKTQGKEGRALAHLMQVSGTGTTAELISHISESNRLQAAALTAQVKTNHHLNVFTDTFSDQYERVIESLGERAKKSEAAKQILGLACMRALLAEKVNDYVSDEDSPCRGSEYKGLINGSLKFEEWVNKPYEQRVCSIRDWFRGSRLIERTNQRVKRSSKSGQQ
jgi:hypothetical protein